MPSLSYEMGKRFAAAGRSGPASSKCGRWDGPYHNRTLARRANAAARSPRGTAAPLAKRRKEK